VGAESGAEAMWLISNNNSSEVQQRFGAFFWWELPRSGVSVSRGLLRLSGSLAAVSRCLEACFEELLSVLAGELCWQRYTAFAACGGATAFQRFLKASYWELGTIL